MRRPPGRFRASGETSVRSLISGSAALRLRLSFSFLRGRFCRSSSKRAILLVSFHRAPGHPHVDEGKNSQHQEEQHTQSACASEIGVLKSVIVDQQNDGHRRVLWSATGDNKWPDKLL